jgi:hypothetical protein
MLLGAALAVTSAIAGPAFAAAAVAPAGSFGSSGGGVGQLNQPTGLVVDSSGIYVADKYNDRITEFNTDGSFRLAFGWNVGGGGVAEVCTMSCQAGTAGAAAGQFNKPTGIARDSAGNLYVADKYNNRVSVFTSAGTFERAFGWGVINGGGALQVCTATCQAGLQGGNAGEYAQTRGVAVGTDGNVYVADEGNNRVSVSTSMGTFVRAFGWGVNGGAGPEVCTATCSPGAPGGGAGQLSGPRDLTLDTDTVYVADSNNNRISEFTPAGGFIRAFGGDVIQGTPPGTGAQVCTTASGCQTGTYGGSAGFFEYAYAVAPDAFGHVYAADVNNNRIDEFTQTGAFVKSFGWGVVSGLSAFEACTTICQPGMYGSGAGQFRAPEGVAFDPAGVIYVADQDNNRIQRFTDPPPAATPPPPTGQRAAALKKCKKKHSKKKRKKCRKKAKKLPV